MNAWQLVKELRAGLGLPAAASFKHCSPAGAAVGVALTPAEAEVGRPRRAAPRQRAALASVARERDGDDFPSATGGDAGASVARSRHGANPLVSRLSTPQVYECASADVGAEAAAAALTPLACAYVRARNADPMCSFGDFIALSDVVDVATAEVIKREVADGVIAPGFEPAALEILAAKKGGKFICLKADADFVPPPVEYREVYGMTFKQGRNDTLVTPELVSAKVVTKIDAMPEAAQRDLVLASIAIKCVPPPRANVRAVGMARRRKIRAGRFERTVGVAWRRQQMRVSVGRSIRSRSTAPRRHAARDQMGRHARGA